MSKSTQNVQRVRRRRLPLAFVGNNAVHRLALVGIVRAHKHPTPVATNCGVVVVPARQPFANVAFQAWPLRRILQPGKQFGAPSLVRPGRDDAGQIVVTPRVGIHIGLQVHAAPARVFDEGHEFLHPTPILLVRDLQVDDIDGHFGSFGDLDGLSDGIKHTESLVANVARENAAVFPHNLAELHEIICGGQRSRRHHQRTGKAERSVPHCFGHKLLHLLHLARAGACERCAHHAFPDVALAHVGADVDGNSGALDRGEVFSERPDLGELIGDGYRVRREFSLVRSG